MPKPLLIAVMGETSSGKTGLAEDLAERLDAQLINADAFQVYRGMDLGTAKSEHKDRYELIDIKDPDEPFGSGEWVQKASAILQALYERGRNAIVVGGSGLNIRALFEKYDTMSGPPDPYLRAHLNRRMEEEGLAALVQELKNLDPDLAARTDLRNPVRVTRALERATGSNEIIHVELPPFKLMKFAIQNAVELTNARIEARAWQMARNGWLEEVETLKQKGYGPNAPGFRAHGYREMWRVLEGELEMAEAVASIVLQVRRYAKRQRTWLKAEPNLTVLQSTVGSEPLQQALDHLFGMGEGARENGQDH